MKYSESTPVKDFILNVLNGVSIGIVAMLIPSAILGTFSSLFMNVPFFKVIYEMTNFVMILMPAVSGYIVGHIFEFTPIQSSGVALAAAVGAGNWKFKNGVFVAKGVGDVINLIIVISIAVLFVYFIGSHLGSFTILLLPSLSVLIPGGIGYLILPYVSYITTWIGNLVNDITKLQPLPMALLLAIIFAAMIVTPISTVGISTAIGLAGIGAGAAGVGITSLGFALCFYGWRVNGVGTSLAHFLGSPKIQMANIMSKPKLLIPPCINAGIMGIVAALFNVKGTPISAGFGVSGGVSYLAAYKFMKPGAMSLIILFVIFIVLPLILGIISKIIFIDVLHFMKPEDFKINVK
ncbi:PTS sugar transporter subunit IIC [Xylocopilactobacillus apicola]|uniref:Membrane protein n=1 Tax=Xylocopilactobacillus apicola TaxID=2932184 RepID=A0AAU9D2W8_9LACO|nr:PTS sugar transporter subunit IIC [Xylocopilactobacillus apicola]BDR57808.1 membrane protein [Xylocopilactobacillus apicola]